MQGIAKPRPAPSAVGSRRVLGSACLTASDPSDAFAAAAAAAAAPAACSGAAVSGRVGRLPVNMPVDLCGEDADGCRCGADGPAAALFQGWDA